MVMCTLSAGFVWTTYVVWMGYLSALTAC